MLCMLKKKKNIRKNREKQVILLMTPNEEKGIISQ